MKALNQDLTNSLTRERQHEMLLALRKTGLGIHIQSELPEIRLSAPFCQWEARDRRRKLHRRSAALFSGHTENEALSFVTWITDACHPTSLTPVAPELLLGQFANAVRSLGVTGVAASTEVDYDAARREWRQTVHAIVRRLRRLNDKEFSAQLKEALVSADDDMAAYRPMVVKPVTDLNGLISYVFKSVSVLSTTQRVTWRRPDGTPGRPIKQALRTPQQRQLLQQTLNGSVSSQLITAFGSEVAQ